MISQMINDKGRIVNNQYVIVSGDAVYFKSYQTMIAKIEDEVLTLSQAYNFSRTTAKYLYKFLRDNGIDVHSIRELEKYMKENDVKVVETLREE